MINWLTIIFWSYIYNLGDVIGSVEAILDVLETYESNQCKLDIIHYGVGNVSVTDIEYASTFKGKLNFISLKKYSCSYKYMTIWNNS